MTDTELDVETLAQRIAARGRDALVERLRTAYADAAAVHADMVSLDDERIEAMVQSAADRADGLQWRRALAGVAAEELDVSVTGGALAPGGGPGADARRRAVLRAEPGRADRPAGAARIHQRRRANGRARWRARPLLWRSRPMASSSSRPSRHLRPTPPSAAPEAADPSRRRADAPETTPEADELETVEADDEVFELLPEPDPIEYETELYDGAAASTPSRTARRRSSRSRLGGRRTERTGRCPRSRPRSAEPEPAAGGRNRPSGADTRKPSRPAEEPSPDEDLHVTAIHLGGVANLPTQARGTRRTSVPDGLDILQGDRGDHRPAGVG